MRLDPARTAVVAIDMHRGHLDPSVATLPLAAERCGPLVKRAAALLAGARLRGVPIVHVVTEYRDAAEIAANPFWKAIHDDPTKARRGILRHNLAGRPGTEIVPELYDPGDLVVRGKKRYSSFHGTDLEFVLRSRLVADTLVLAGINTTTTQAPRGLLVMMMTTSTTAVTTAPRALITRPRRQPGPLRVHH